MQGHYSVRDQYKIDNRMTFIDLTNQKLVNRQRNRKEKEEEKEAEKKKAKYNRKYKRGGQQ